MGYRGKVVEQEKARQLRAEGYSMDEIAALVGVSKSSVSLWTRDVPCPARPRRYASGVRSSHPQRLAKLRQIEELNELAVARIGQLSDHAFLVVGTALYAGEGSKSEGSVRFANSDPRMVAFFCAWLRRFFEIDEARLRLRLYLHEGLDLEAANAFWANITGIPEAQFGKPYRAVPDAGIRNNKHEHGCASVVYSCSRTHRAVMGLVRALLSSVDHLPGW
jgi:hypothetical protein